MIFSIGALSALRDRLSEPCGVDRELAECLQRARIARKAEASAKRQKAKAEKARAAAKAARAARKEQRRRKR